MAYRGVAPQRLSVGAAAVVVDDAGGRGVAGADGRQGHGAAAQAGATKEDFVVARAARTIRSPTPAAAAPAAAVAQRRRRVRIG